MSTITFVRHAQASLFQADYDRLSERGHSQARQLGCFLNDQGLSYDAVYAGPGKRHRQTAEIVACAQRLPERSISVMSEFDENQIDRLVTQHLDAIGAEFPDVALLDQAFRTATDATRQQAFARMFAAVARLWAANRCVRPEVETAAAFRERVNAGIDEVVDRAGPGQHILVFTSVGPIAAAMQRALCCADSIAVDLGWRIRNSSITEFVFSEGRFTLDRFNSMSHLSDQVDWTYW